MPLNHTYWITTQSAHLSPAHSNLRPHLQHAHLDSRRQSRFTQLALLGAASQRIPANTPIYLGASFHSPSTFLRNFNTLLTHHQPSPIDFMANLHNSALFHLAQHLGSHGSTLFLAIDRATLWQPLWLGLNHLIAHPHSHILIGWAHETPPDDPDPTPEGSLWWHISPTQTHPDSIRLTLTPATHPSISTPDIDNTPREQTHAPTLITTPTDPHFWPDILAIHHTLQQRNPCQLPPHGYPDHLTITLTPPSE